MALQLLDSVRQLLADVEEASGKKISPVENPELTVPVIFNLPDKNSDRIDLYYNPHDHELIDYALASQAGHLLRFFAAPPAERFVSVANRRTMAVFIMETESELERLTAIFGREKVRQMIARWYQGVVFQLTRMPTDIMVNKWLHDRFPELRPRQLQGLAVQREQALRSLSPEVRRATPARIYHAANIMNFVFFKVIEDHLQADFLGPYHGTIFILAGAALARITAARSEDSHAGDRAMIDCWAKELEFHNWYEWQLYETFSSHD